MNLGDERLAVPGHPLTGTASPGEGTLPPTLAHLRFIKSTITASASCVAYTLNRPMTNTEFIARHQAAERHPRQPVFRTDEIYFHVTDAALILALLAAFAGLVLILSK